MPVPAITIGSEAAEHVTLEVTRRELPNAADYWDGTWIYTTVRIRVGAFRGEYEALLRTDEIAQLRTGLGQRHRWTPCSPSSR